MVSAATRGATAAERDRRDQVIDTAGNEQGQAPAFLDGLVKGAFPTIQGRGRPATPLAADLVTELEDSLSGESYARRTWPVKSVQNEKNRIKAWGKKHSPALAFDFVTVHTENERATVAIRAKVAPAE